MSEGLFGGWIGEKPAAGSSATWLSLLDTPNTYVPGQAVRVNATGTGLEFYTPGTTDLDTVLVACDCHIIIDCAGNIVTSGC